MKTKMLNRYVTRISLLQITKQLTLMLKASRDKIQSEFCVSERDIDFYLKNIVINITFCTIQ